MSTVKQHLWFLWRELELHPSGSPGFQYHASLFVQVHIKELIELAGGIEPEDWMEENMGAIQTQPDGETK